MEGFLLCFAPPSPARNSSLASCLMLLTFWLFWPAAPPPPWNSQYPSIGWVWIFSGTTQSLARITSFLNPVNVNKPFKEMLIIHCQNFISKFFKVQQIPSSLKWVCLLSRVTFFTKKYLTKIMSSIWRCYNIGPLSAQNKMEVYIAGYAQSVTESVSRHLFHAW